jgi:hypothetical protein
MHKKTAIKKWRLSVEARRIELLSKHIHQKLSTCLSCFDLSGNNWEPATDYFRSWMVLSNTHSLELQHLVLF